MSITLPAKNLPVKYNQDLPADQASLIGQQGTAQARTDQSYGAAQAGYSGLMNSQGYSPQEQSAIQTTGNDTLRAGYAGLRDQYSRQAARTGNTAGYFGGMAAAGQGQARDLAAGARQNTVDFANEKERRQEEGIKGEASLFGQASTNQSALNDFRSRLAALRTTEPSTGGSSSYNYSGNYGNTASSGK